MLSKIDHEFAFVQSALSIRASRQEVLAANLANSDTPGFKARDLDFAEALRSAMGGVNGGLTLARTSARHLEGGVAGGLSDEVLKYRSTVQPSLDGNTVDPDVERAHFAENAMHYQFLLERARGTAEKLKMALSEAR